MLHSRNRRKKNKGRFAEKHSIRLKTTPGYLRFLKDAEAPNSINQGLKKRNIIFIALLMLGAVIMSIIESNITIKVLYITVLLITLALLIGSIIELHKIKKRRRENRDRLQRIEDHRTIL